MKRGFILGLAFGTLLLYFFTSSDVYAEQFSYSTLGGSWTYIEDGTQLVDTSDTPLKWLSTTNYRGYYMNTYIINYYNSAVDNYSLQQFDFWLNGFPTDLNSDSGYILDFYIYTSGFSSSELTDTLSIYLANPNNYLGPDSPSSISCDFSTNDNYSIKVQCKFNGSWFLLGSSSYDGRFDIPVVFSNFRELPDTSQWRLGVYDFSLTETTAFPDPSVPTPTPNPNQGVEDAIGDLTGDIMDDTPPDLDGLGDSAGWLPAGPVDSLINLPLTMLQNLANALGSTCEPLTLNLPFVDEDIQLPCLVSVYNKMGELPIWLNTIGTVASGFILFGYFLNLYDWVDNRIKMKDNARAKDWGGS